MGILIVSEIVLCDLAGLVSREIDLYNLMKQADRPDSVTTVARYDSHSSRRWIAPVLKLSTRTLREQHQRVPI